MSRARVYPILVASMMLTIAFVPLGASADGPGGGAVRLCAGGIPPVDAVPPGARLERLFISVVEVAGEPSTLMLSPAVDGYCLTQHAIVLAPNWLAADALAGPPGRAPAFAALAWLLALERYHFHPPASGDRGAGVGAAQLAGCHLARAGVRGADAARQSAALASLIDQSVQGDGVDWAAAVRRGYRACTP